MRGVTGGVFKRNQNAQGRQTSIQARGLSTYPSHKTHEEKLVWSRGGGLEVHCPRLSGTCFEGSDAYPKSQMPQPCPPVAGAASSDKALRDTEVHTHTQTTHLL